MELNSVSELIEEIRQGRMVILVDDEDRENEGDLIIAADAITSQLVNFMACEARGLICLALTSEQIDRLDLPLMVKDDINRSPNRTAFTVSIEAAEGVSTGISAADRAHTIRVASSPQAQRRDIIVPGHIFPIRAQVGGVLKRAGHTEASVDLVGHAGRNPAAVICEIMNADGTMARLPELKKFAQKHKIKIGTIESLIEYRIQNETFVEETEQKAFHCALGTGFNVHVFRNKLDGSEHFAFVKGAITSPDPVLVRVQTEYILGDVFQAKEMATGEFLRSAMSAIDRHGRGVLVYLQSPCRGTLAPSDERDYGLGAQILRALGLHKIRLLTNHPSKRVGLKGYGLEIVETVPISVKPISHNRQLEH